MGRFFWSLLLLLLSLKSVLSLVVSTGVPTRDNPAKATSRPTLLPEQDVFYDPPPGFEKTSPGTILKHRPVPNPLTLDNVNPIKPKAAWQLLYRTQNSVGKPSASIVTVIEPWNAKPNHHFAYSFFSVLLLSINSKSRAYLNLGLRIQRVNTSHLRSQKCRHTKNCSCNPSVTLQVGTLADNTFNQLQTSILVEALVLGYYVTVADYGGEQAAFCS